MHRIFLISATIPNTPVGAQRNGKICRARPLARGRSVRQALRRGGVGVLPLHWEDAVRQGAAGEGLPEYWPQEGLLVLVLIIFNFMHCT